MTTLAQMKERAEQHDNKGHSQEMCIFCGWVMGGPPLNCLNNDTPHVFPSQLPKVTPAFAEQHLDLICRGIGHEVGTLRDQVTGLSELVNDMLRLTPEEKRAMEASVELAHAMRALVGNEEWVMQSDWSEIASRIHDLQARIILHAGSRFGWTRPLGG